MSNQTTAAQIAPSVVRVFADEAEAGEYLMTIPADAERVERFKQEAAADRQAAQESFDRCDTDGFLSQACHGIMAGKRDEEARLAEHGGCGVFRCLIDADNQLVSSKLFILVGFKSWERAYKWCVPGANPNDKATWITDGPRAVKKAGYRAGYIVAPGFVSARSPFDRTPEQRGTGGIGSVHYSARLDHKKAGLDK